MKILTLCLLSLLSFVSRAQNIDVPGEIERAGKQMLARHSSVWADTCIKKIELRAAKLYVDALEKRYDKALKDNALLTFQVDQRAQRIDAMGEINTGLTTALEDSEKNRKIGNWACAVLGAAVGALAVFLGTQ